MTLFFQYFSFFLIRAATLPFSYLPYSALHSIGRVLGNLAYYLIPKYRKRALSNLSLASELKLDDKDIVRIAKESFQNLLITCLEYPKLAREKNFDRLATCQNPETAAGIIANGQGIVFFCAHQANWEVLFLEATRRMPGVAIGRPIKNKMLYNWILSIRQKCGGKIITPKEAAKEGLRALKKGSFLGIVGDQGMPDSGFSSSFLGRRAWTSPMPAILSYRTGCPILVAITKRAKGGKYLIHYSDPIWPNQEAPMDKELPRLMQECLAYLEESIKEKPGEWMWQHNRWKQQTTQQIKRSFRQESLCIIMPENDEEFKNIYSHIGTLKNIYSLAFFTFFVPEKFQNIEFPEGSEIRFYKTLDDILVKDFRFKLVFNFHGDKRIKPHFLSLSAFSVVTIKDLKKAADLSDPSDLSLLFQKALLHPN